MSPCSLCTASEESGSSKNMLVISSDLCRTTFNSSGSIPQNNLSMKVLPSRRGPVNWCRTSKTGWTRAFSIFTWWVAVPMITSLLFTIARNCILLSDFTTSSNSVFSIPFLTRLRPPIVVESIVYLAHSSWQWSDCYGHVVATFMKQHSLQNVIKSADSCIRFLTWPFMVFCSLGYGLLSTTVLVVRLFNLCLRNLFKAYFLVRF